MLVFIKNWVLNNTLRLITWGAAFLSVVTVLFGARQAGQNAERADQLKKSLEIKDAQLRATLNAPRTRNELIDSLRNGKF